MREQECPEPNQIYTMQEWDIVQVLLEVMAGKVSVVVAVAICKLKELEEVDPIFKVITAR